MMPILLRWLRGPSALVLVAAVASQLWAANLNDLLDAEKLARFVKATGAQRPALAADVQRLREAVADYQMDRGRRTCEVLRWRGEALDISEQRDLRRKARKRIDAILDTLKSRLDPGQSDRIRDLLKKDDNILDAPTVGIPFERINNTPLFPRFKAQVEAYRVSLPGTPSPLEGWSYGDYLRLWTARGYIPSGRPIDELQQEQSDIFNRPDLQVRALPGSPQDKIAKSPLLLAATLLVPDLAWAESELLWNHYPHEAQDREEMWADYRRQNHLDDEIQVRVNMSTPHARAYLNLDRWIVDLQDEEGTGFEPIRAEQIAFNALEALEISLPGREAEVTDVFGSYTGMPGYRDHIYLEAPSKIVYTGHEKLVAFYFPGRDFRGKPIVDGKTRSVKLVVQSQHDDFGRTELEWNTKRRAPTSPPKDR